MSQEMKAFSGISVIPKSLSTAHRAEKLFWNRLCWNSRQLKKDVEIPLHRHGRRLRQKAGQGLCITRSGIHKQPPFLFLFNHTQEPDTSVPSGECVVWMRILQGDICYLECRLHLRAGITGFTYRGKWFYVPG